MSANPFINYVELPCRDITKTKAFFATVFNWTFIDYGEDYCEFHDKGITGGFYKADKVSLTADGATLLVFYSASLETTQAAITAAGGVITHPIFTFPGGRRFHFTEPSGNEFAVWSDT